MRQLRALVLICILLGLFSLSFPLKFYGVMSGIFGSLSPAPFDFSVVRTFTFIFALPAVTLLLLGVALYYITVKLERVAELEVIRESGERIGGLKKVRIDENVIKSFVTDEEEVIDKDEIMGVDDAVVVKVPENEYEGKEVYSEVGEFLGYVKSVITDDNGIMRSLEVEKKGRLSEIRASDILSSENVVIVRAV